MTGGARGIGRAIALALAGRGYRVAIADLDAAAARKLPLQFLRCDVASEPSVRACVRAAVKRFGRLDALVNNAGIAAPHLRARHRSRKSACSPLSGGRQEIGL